MRGLLNENALSNCRRNIFVICAFCIIILLIYSHTFNASWHFDDYPNIVNRAELHLKEISWEQIKKTFSDSDTKNFYRPLVALSFAINYYYSGKDTTGYHFINIFIHFINSFILFLFIYKILNLPILKFRFTYSSYSIALLSSIFWMINPIQTQAITFIVQRMASMATMFYLLSMFFYLKARLSEKLTKSILFYFICFIASIMAFACKENTVLLPISILIFDLFFIQGISSKSLKKSTIIFLFLCALPVLLGILLIGPSLFDFDKIINSFQNRNFTMFERMLTQPRIILLYLSLIFYPMPNRLCLLHDIEISKGLFTPPSTFFSIIIILLAISISIVKSKKYPLISYCIIFFFLNHSIESSFLNLELAYEHRNYLPSLFIFIPIAIILLKAIEYFSYNKKMQIIIISFIILVLIGLGNGTYMRNYIWRTEESFWLDAVEKNPNSRRAHNNLAKAYSVMGEHQKAMELYHKVLKLPEDSHGTVAHITHYNLALKYKQTGDIDKQIEHFKSCIEINSGYFKAYKNLAIALFMKEEYEDAYLNIIKYLTYQPKCTIGHSIFGNILIMLKRYDAALKEFKIAFNDNNLVSKNYYNVGITYKYLKNYDSSIKFLSQSLRLDGTNLLTYFHLAESMVLSNEKNSAVKKLIIAIKQFGPEAFSNQITSFIQKPHFEVMPDWDVVLPLVKGAFHKIAEDLRKNPLQLDHI